MPKSGSTRKRRKTEPTHSDLEIGARETMPARKPVELHLRTTFPEQLRERFALLRRYDRVGPARHDLHRNAAEIGERVGNERNHGAEQQRAAQSTRSEEQY